MSARIWHPRPAAPRVGARRHSTPWYPVGIRGSPITRLTGLGVHGLHQAATALATAAIAAMPAAHATI